MEFHFFSAIGNGFAQGGVWMVAILVAQIVSIAIIAERLLVLYVWRLPNQLRLTRYFEDDIRQGRIERVIEKSMSLGKRNSLVKVVQAGAQAALDMGGRDEIQSKMEEVLMGEATVFQKRTGFLSMLANVGTLLGLLGTIVGLIQAFSSVNQSANQVEKSSILTEGVSVAMYTTAYGLIMAIPALIMYAILQNRTNRLVEDLNQAAMRIFNWLSYNYEPIPTKKSKTR